MNLTSIEWVKNPDGSQGYTWNPITGCLNHDNGLCKGGGFPCYAYKLANGRLRSRYLANDNTPITHLHEPTEGYRAYADPFYPRFWEDRLDDPFPKDQRYWWKLQKGIFVCDMGELFGNWIPEGWQKQIFKVIYINHQHRFYLLTKQPQNLIKWSPFPDNCWVGVTATDEHMTAVGLGCLRDIEAKVKFMSFEPLLNWCEYHHPFWVTWFKDINWLIIGAQTKPYKPPKIEWVQEIVEAADRAGIPIFLKDNLLELVNYQSPKTDFAFNKDGYYRQEMPDAKN